MKLQRDLREFIALFNSARVEYVIVGGHAVAFHGHPRFTGDIDFLIRPTMTNARKVVVALRAFGFGKLALTAEDFVKPDLIVQLGRPPNRIDILTSISGVSFDDAWASRARSKLDGLSISLLGFDALIKNKTASGRDKDLVDVRKLKAVKAVQRK